MCSRYKVTLRDTDWSVFNEANDYSIGTNTIYPNPYSGNFTQLINDEQRTGAFKVFLYNTAGKAVDSYSGEKKGTFRKDYELQLSKGMYLMRINWKDRADYKKVIVN